MTGEFCLQSYTFDARFPKRKKIWAKVWKEGSDDI